MEITRKNAKKNWKYSNRIIRYSDLFFALIAIVISSPILLIIAVWIKLEDPKGSIFFKQKRIGKYGKPFLIYKFRSMYHGSEDLLEELKNNNEMNGHMFKIKNDPRITKVGGIIRRLSLDELPQLVNVLKGDMCLVGPRPGLESEYEKYSTYDLQRIQVKPGCTGLWQVSGRNQLTFEEMVELDLYYIKHQSLRLNLKIILRTFKEFTYKGSGY
ncbi:sugar transferase [Carnobacterium maltaromaticum]|uniref:Sugar transferase n=1 Tax=Carnobacterium maltaromaticum TaxID=2751 RepID=A0AAW9JY67_CARML|nr:sugar transferase [Carnobacterium maltaromaticum]MDZ5759574.1 sugar transferase [Carnobacterium maltaromaticum]